MHQASEGIIPSAFVSLQASVTPVTLFYLWFVQEKTIPKHIFPLVFERLLELTQPQEENVSINFTGSVLFSFFVDLRRMLSLMLKEFGCKWNDVTIPVYQQLLNSNLKIESKTFALFFNKLFILSDDESLSKSSKFSSLIFSSVQKYGEQVMLLRVRLTFQYNRTSPLDQGENTQDSYQINFG